MATDAAQVMARMRQHTPFLLTGSGRCGTGYTSNLLTELGYDCGHEVAFDWKTLANNTWPVPFALRGCDSSWLAMPVMSQLPPETVILHQVRNPVKVVRSLMGIRFLSPEQRASDPYSRIADTVAQCPDDELEACMHFWTEWNAQIEERAAGRPYRRFRVEDIDAFLVREIVSLIEPDRALTDREIDIALAAVPNTFNTRTRDEAITWNSLPPGATLDAFSMAADAFGYGNKELAAA